MGLLVVAGAMVAIGLLARRAQARSPFWRNRLKFGQGGLWPPDDEFPAHPVMRGVEAQRGTEFLMGRFVLFLGSVLLVIALLELAA